jgi:MGT family glycosyltransferase
MHHEPLLAAIVEALEGSGVRSVITLGRVLDAAAVHTPAGGIVCEWVAHDSLLAHADAVITHAGLGTTLCALNAGTPLVCLPIDRDQPATAANIAALGAGVALDPEAGSETIRDALTEVLSDPAYRRAAQKLSRRISRLGRGERAVEAVEAIAAHSSGVPLEPAID